MNDNVNKQMGLAFLLIVVLFLSACGILPIDEEPVPTRVEPAPTVAQNTKPAPTQSDPVAATTQDIPSTPTQAIEATDIVVAKPTNTVAAVEATTGPPTPIDYINEETGISFSYPDYWTMEEEANVIVLRNGSISLRIVYRGVNEQVTLWTRTGIPAGDVVVLDSPVSFLGQALSKNGLVYENKLKAVFFGGGPACIVKSDTMDFNITLEDQGSVYLTLDIPDDVLDEAASILTSFDVTSTEDGPPNELLTYVNPEYGFSLQYPPTWSAVEVNDEAFVGPGSRSVQLSRGTATLVIGYRRAGEDTIAMGSGAPAGDFESRGTVFVGDNHVPRQVLVFEGKDKAVFYEWEPGSLIGAGWKVFAPRLVDFAQVDYRAIELSQEVQDEADLILSSLEVSCRDG
jgi:hypothetical protein